MSKILGISRHRLGSDGVGVTTLVGFWGCPLRCKYCLNPKCFDENARTVEYSPEELYEKLKIDDLYFVSTGGGVTFGGGEPLLNSAFIKKFCEIVKGRWSINVETCLNVPRKNLLEIIDYVNEFFVDIKDTNNEIYKSYTGLDNKRALDNLALLVSNHKNITVRLPLIKGYNTQEDREKSEALLKNMGVVKLDKFEYRVK